MKTNTTMEIQFQPLLAAATIVKEATGILRMNRRFTIPIASFGILLSSTLVVTNFLSLRTFFPDLTQKLGFLLVTSPTSAEYANLLIGLQKDISIFFGWEWIFVPSYFIVNTLFSIATVYASAIFHRGKDPISIDIRYLAKLTAASWKRPFLTSLYTSIFGFGYVFLVLAILLPVALPGALPGATFATTVLCVVAGLLYNYVSVVWAVGLVVSAVENRSGIEALGEAARLVKGMRLQGYALGLVVSAILLIIGQYWRLVSFKRPWRNELIVFMAVNLMLLVRMFGLTCYTVYYYECKSFLGEEVLDDELMIVGDDTVGYTPV